MSDSLFVVLATTAVIVWAVGLAGLFRLMDSLHRHE